MATPIIPTQRAVIVIDQVDVVRRTVHGIDKTGGKFQAAYLITGTGFQIPLPGEHWRIWRDSNMWHLEERFDKPSELTKSGLNPGDVHFRSPGDVIFDTGVLTTGSGQIAATTRDTALISGNTSTFTLSGTPVHPYTVMVYKNGALLHPDIDWTIAGSVVTFTVGLVSNNKLTIYFQRTGAEYRLESTVTSVADLSSSLDFPYNDISGETSLAVVSAWESR